MTVQHELACCVERVGLQTNGFRKKRDRGHEVTGLSDKPRLPFLNSGVVGIELRRGGVEIMRLVLAAKFDQHVGEIDECVEVMGPQRKGLAKSRFRFSGSVILAPQDTEIVPSFDVVGPQIKRSTEADRGLLALPTGTKQ